MQFDAASPSAQSRGAACLVIVWSELQNLGHAHVAQISISANLQTGNTVRSLQDRETTLDSSIHPSRITPTQPPPGRDPIEVQRTAVRRPECKYICASIQLQRA